MRSETEKMLAFLRIEKESLKLRFGKNWGESGGNGEREREREREGRWVPLYLLRWRPTTLIKRWVLIILSAPAPAEL